MVRGTIRVGNGKVQVRKIAREAGGEGVRLDEIVRERENSGVPSSKDSPSSAIRRGEYNRGIEVAWEEGFCFAKDCWLGVCCSGNSGIRWLGDRIRCSAAWFWTTGRRLSLEASPCLFDSFVTDFFFNFRLIKDEDC